jgi:hypothetical protein
MVRPLVRSLVSAVVALCFAVMASTGGAMPACAAAGTGTSHAAHGSAGHAGGHHGVPASSQGCVVHLCCAHVLVAPTAGLGSDRVVSVSAAAGFVPSADLPDSRTPHALPFAQAPPAPLV